MASPTPAAAPVRRAARPPRSWCDKGEGEAGGMKASSIEKVRVEYPAGESGRSTEGDGPAPSPAANLGRVRPPVKKKGGPGTGSRRLRNRGGGRPLRRRAPLPVRGGGGRGGTPLPAPGRGRSGFLRAAQSGGGNRCASGGAFPPGGRAGRAGREAPAWPAPCRCSSRPGGGARRAPPRGSGRAAGGEG